MITLGEARERVTEKLAEVSSVFWTEPARNRAINDAARMVAVTTKGVIQDFPTSGVQVQFGSAPLAGVNLINVTYDTVKLPAVSIEEATMTNRNTLKSGLRPRWLLVDERAGVGVLHPLPSVVKPWTVTANVIPPQVNQDTQELFLGSAYMDRYITPTILLACAYLLLQERFDGDAERFYQMALQELTVLGVDATTFPPLQQGLGPKQVA